MTAPAESLTAQQAQVSPTQAKVVVSPGGVEAWHVDSDVVPLIAVAFTFEGGSAQDPAEKPGVAQMLSRLLDEGAGRYDSDAFQERLAARAIELSFNAGNDAVGGSLKTLVKHADEAFELLRLALAEPRFDPESIERVRAQTIAGLALSAERPGRDGDAPLLRRGLCRPSLRPARPRARSRASKRSRATTSSRCIAPSSRGAAPRSPSSARSTPSACAAFSTRCSAASPSRRRSKPVPADDARAPRLARRRRSRRAAIGDPLRHAGRVMARPGFHPRLCAQPHPRRRRLHLAPVPGGAREARPRLQRRHLARQLPRRRDDLGLHGDEERARRRMPRA